MDTEASGRADASADVVFIFLNLFYIEDTTLVVNTDNKKLCCHSRW